MTVGGSAVLSSRRMQPCETPAPVETPDAGESHHNPPVNASDIRGRTARACQEERPAGPQFRARD